MRRKDRKTRCQKRMIQKCKEVCKTFDPVQYSCAEMLSACEEIQEIRCNVLLEGLESEAEYTSDFVCVKEDGSLAVRECVFRKHLTKPMTARLLEMSRRYWEERAVTDWGIVIDGEK